MSDAIDRAAEVMIEHTRTGIISCRCGWSGWADLGKSHAEHVARALADAGLLATPEHDAAVAAKALREAADDLNDPVISPDVESASDAVIYLYDSADQIEAGESGE